MRGFLGFVVCCGGLGIGAPGFSQSASPQGRSVTNAQGSPLELATPVELPGLFEELSDSFLSEDLIEFIERRHAFELQDLSLRHGFIDQNRHRRDLGNPKLSQAQELKTRKAMATSMQNYMLIHGLPNFLSSREGTKNLGMQYQNTVKKAQGATRLDLSGEKTKTWKFSAGINPFVQVKPWVQKGWLQYSYKTWTLQTSQYIDSFKYTNRWTLGLSQKEADRTWHSTYWLQRRLLQSGVRWQLNSDLSTGISTVLPLEGTNRLARTVTKVALRYVF